MQKWESWPLNVTGNQKSSQVWKSNSKCCNFFIWCPNSIKLVVNFLLSSLLCVVNFSNQSKMYWFFEAIQNSRVQLEFTKLHFDGRKFGACIFFIQCSFSITFVGLCFSWSLVIVVKFSCQSKFFGMFRSNSKFKIQAFLDYNELCSLFLLHTMSISNHFFGKVAHTSLVCIIKFHINPRSYKWLRSIFLEGGLAIDVVFAMSFTIFWHFKSILQTQWVNWMIFSFTNVFVC